MTSTRMYEVRLGMALYFVAAATRAEAVEIAKAKAKAEAAKTDPVSK